ncbi:MAG: transporter substrate-binding domain-containing protein [Thermodesulfobacteriota bacterium]|nr:transporter substrate-binding domain-containing protein [Thermodesulfobacteriota bacterium]
MGKLTKIMAVVSIVLLCMGSIALADLADIKARGVIRHIGVPYANFVTGSGDGMSVDIVKLFAKEIGVEYKFVKSSWGSIFSDLTGMKVKSDGSNVRIIGSAPVKGDLIANGLTILPWRQKLVNYAIQTFPTQVWMLTRADSEAQPVIPSGDINKDIINVKKSVQGKTVFGVPGTCLDPLLYSLKEAGIEPVHFKGNLNELAPAVINKDAYGTILDVPDSLVALEKWPGQLKILGPVSSEQGMAVGFPKRSVKLLDEFNAFIKKIKKDGTYLKIIKKYYPAALIYYPEFFK